MYKGRSKQLQTRTDKGLKSKNGRSKGPKNGKPKGKLHASLEASATDTQRATWLRYLERCKETGTVPVIPADVRRKLGI